MIEHLAAHAEPPELVALERDELRRLRHLPAEGLSGQRARIEAAMKRTGERYTWGDIDEATYRVEAMAPPEGFEPPTPALGRRRSIH